MNGGELKYLGNLFFILWTICSRCMGLYTACFVLLEYYLYKWSIIPKNTIPGFLLPCICRPPKTQYPCRSYDSIRVSPFRLKKFSLISEMKRIWIRFTCVSLFYYKISLLFYRFFSLIFASNVLLRITWVIFASKRNKAKRISSLFFCFLSLFSLFFAIFRYFSTFFRFSNFCFKAKRNSSPFFRFFSLFSTFFRFFCFFPNFFTFFG